MSTIFVHKTRKVYYHRTNVPARLKRLLNGRAQLWRSLKTKDKDEAKTRSAVWDARVQQLFRSLRRHGEGMNHEEREALIAYWLESELEYAEDCRALAGPVSDDRRESFLEGLSIMQEQAHEALVGNDYRKVEREADDLLKAAGLPALDHDGVEFARLCR